MNYFSLIAKHCLYMSLFLNSLFFGWQNIGEAIAQPHPHPPVPTAMYYVLNLSKAVYLTSATTPTQPQMAAALACAPLIPPSPDVTKTWNQHSNIPVYIVNIPICQHS